MSNRMFFSFFTCSTCFNLMTSVKFNIFMAQYSSVDLFRQRRTLPNVPVPGKNILKIITAVNLIYFHTFESFTKILACTEVVVQASRAGCNIHRNRINCTCVSARQCKACTKCQQNNLVFVELVPQLIKQVKRSDVVIVRNIALFILSREWPFLHILWET